MRLHFTSASKETIEEKDFDIIINSTGAYPTEGVNENDVIYANTKVASFINEVISQSSKETRLILNYSSLSVYGDLEIKSITDETRPSPVTTYGTTKLLSEQILEMNNRSVNVVNLRFPVVLGKNAHRAWLPSVLHKMKMREDIEIRNPMSIYNACTSLKNIFLFTEKLISNKEYVTNSCPLFCK